MLILKSELASLACFVQLISFTKRFDNIPLMPAIVCKIIVQNVRFGSVLDELDVSEGKMSAFAFQFALPLAVDVRLGHQYDVVHLQLQGGFVVCVWYPRLLDTCVCGQFALQRNTRIPV